MKNKKLKILVLNMTKVEILYNILVDLEDIEEICYDVFDCSSKNISSLDLSEYDLFVFFTGELYKDSMFEDKKKIICVSDKEFIEETEITQRFIMDSKVIEDSRYTSEDKTLPALIKRLLNIPLSAKEKQELAKKEMDALLAAIGKQVSVSLIRAGVPCIYSGELLKVVPYSLIQMSQTPGISYLPFIGMYMAITKIQDGDGVILFQNETEFPHGEWSRSDMDTFRVEKWGTAKHNPIVI